MHKNDGSLGTPGRLEGQGPRGSTYYYNHSHQKTQQNINNSMVLREASANNSFSLLQSNQKGACSKSFALDRSFDQQRQVTEIYLDAGSRSGSAKKRPSVSKHFNKENVFGGHV